MKKKLLLIAFFQVWLTFAQEDAWVYFTDKPDAASYLANPSAMLSQRALDRRAAQNIPVDIADVPLHTPYVEAVAGTPGIVIKSASKWFNCLHVRGSEASINSLTSLSFVDHIVFANANLNPAPRRPQSRLSRVAKWTDIQVNYPYGSSENQVQQLNGHYLHQMDYTGSGKYIAVLDAGFPGVDTASPFQRLRDNNGILGGYDFVNDATDFYSGGNHGTTVLSTMAGYVPDALVGTAPDASYYLFITEDVASENPVEESYWVEAAERADSLGVDVINTSLGYFGYDNPDYSHTYADMNGTTTFISKGVNMAFSRGMIVVVSAGNSGNSAEPHIGAPADALSALTIGAVNASGQYASFSSIGPSYDGRVKPDVVAQGAAVFVAQPNGAVTISNGTSFSGPITAGLVACLWQALPELSNQEIIDLVRQSASLYDNPTTQLGYGIPDFNLAIAMSVEGFEPAPYAVYPNPFSQSLTVTVPKVVTGATLEVTDTTGKRVLEAALTALSQTFELSGLATGFYFYKVQSGGMVRTGKIVKR
ncbi:MAG TPA: S8 family serine peptidase [Flavobacterium sp.]|nr:S8 family serine peptidase [Flavobacterium sp.]